MREVLDDFCDTFRRQKYEKDFFDVIFDVDGKIKLNQTDRFEKLYAHRGILASASPVFKELIMKNHSTLNQVIIQIDGYSYYQFFEFLCCIYSAKEEFYPEEIYFDDIIELAHRYKVKHVKEGCAKVLADELCVSDLEECFQEMETIFKYTWTRFEKKVDTFIRENFEQLIQFDGFANLGQSAIQAFVSFARNIDDQEKLCEAVLKWGKHQDMITVEMSDEEKNDLILHQITDILPSFTLNSLLQFFVNEKGLISVNEAKKVKTIQVKIESGENSIIGTFVDSYGIFEYIKSNEDHRMYIIFEKHCGLWYHKFEIPNIPSNIQKRDGIEWYLLFDINCELCVKHHSNIEENDYLIAEMKASIENETVENGEFMIERFGKVHATVSRKYEQLFNLP